MSEIHPTVLLKMVQRLEKMLKIGPFVYISSRAAIGDNTVIGSHAVIEGRTP